MGVGDRVEPLTIRDSCTHRSVGLCLGLQVCGVAEDHWLRSPSDFNILRSARRKHLT